MSFEIDLTISDFNIIRKALLGYYKTPDEKTRDLESKIKFIVENLSDQEHELE